MGKLILRNNGVETQFVNGEDFTTLVPQADTHILGFDSVTGGLEGLDPDGNITSYGSSNTNTYDVTYSELVNSITGGTLDSGAYYIITDFQTCYDVPEYYINGSPKGSDVVQYSQGSIEPIIVLAISANTISSTAYQPLYPNDRIQYDWTFNTTDITGGVAFGRITERIDEFNNRTDYDHRNILFNRFQSYNKNSQLTGTIMSLAWGQSILMGNGTSFLSEVNPGDILLIDGYQFGGIGVKVVSATTDNQLTIVTDSSFVGIPFCGETYSFYTVTSTGNYDEYKEVYVGQKNEEDWDNFLTFNLNGTAVHNYVGDYSRFYLEDNVSNSGFLLANNVFYGNDIYSNTIGDRSYNNTGRYWFVRNTIAGRFYNNMIHQNGFYSNSIGEYFNNNIIKSSMWGNRIGQYFESNEIYNQFYDNDIDNGFYGNKIYSSFYENKIGIYFDGNEITQQFYKNVIGAGFSENLISGNTYTNIIGEQFYNNTIYSDFYDNQIFNEFKGNITYLDFFNNKTSWGFGGNEFSGYCTSNTFGEYIDSNDFLGDVSSNNFKGAVYGNTVGDEFIFNNIGTVFFNNIISQSFQNNEIGNFFEENTVGNYFQNNNVSTPVNSVDFTINYGNVTAFTYTPTATGATDNIYLGVSGTTSGFGVNATFDIEVSGGTVVGVSGNSQGQQYIVNDTITISGYDYGTTQITVTGISINPSVYETYNCQIFERQGGDNRLSYYDSLDTLIITNINE